MGVLRVLVVEGVRAQRCFVWAVIKVLIRLKYWIFVT